MDCQEAQQEEREVLRSIYEGDERFKEVSDSTFQYKIGEESDTKTFLVEVTWNDTYPETVPNINLDAFYNKRILPQVKEHIVTKLTEEANSFLGMAMTYSLFEYAKENVDNFMSNQPATLQADVCESTSANCKQSSTTAPAAAVTKEKKEHLTKAQKRRMINRLDEKGEMPRGWNWIDVVKHLCQTGRADETS